MAVNNKDIKHWLRADSKHYICNQATGITRSKVAKDYKYVTCKNCLKILKKTKNYHTQKFDDYNQGRIEADSKWIKAINDRIEELEKQAGIPELKKLKRDIAYRWKDDNKD